ncbi:MAG: serine/threonine-protein kinase, partial [Jaaginema sp. PMC 1080.18]|nr:serine/threonine-protein kinase [Jaaginema sp. PMC 1080.18]
MENALDSGKILAQRYRILYTLSHDNLGRTYLAEIVDSEKGDRVILKELSDRLTSPLLHQDSDRLRQNFAPLENLDHPQLPHFRDLLQVQTPNRDRLIIVQDHIEGLTYRELLNARQQQGRSFSEVEVRDLLQNLLPVLNYLHERQINCGDLCLESLILRHQDRLPVLSHISSLPSLLLTPEHQLTTALPRQPEAPEALLPGERPHTDFSPQNDFYTLAVSILVLLSGREPQYLKNPQTQTWDWSYLHLTPEFQALLQQMLGEGDRPPHANTLLTALQACPPPLTEATP